MSTKHTLQYAEEPDLDSLVVVKKFNQWMAQVRTVPVAKSLFGRSWLEGEIAVLTGDAGTGKSLFGVQIAETIARGKDHADALSPDCPAFSGDFGCDTEPQKVLYINLKQSSQQFAMRYAEEFDPEDGETLQNPYQFSQNLHRVDIDIHCKLPEGYKTFDEILSPLVERLAHKYKAKVVIIDSITSLQRSVYGYQETYAMMKGLHRINRNRGISILVLARTSGAKGKTIGSCPTQFSRFADSVFTLGKSRLDPSVRYLKQLLVHSSTKIYDEEHVASFIVRRLSDNFLGFEHYGFHKESEHFQPIPEDRLWPAIDKVKTLSDEGRSIREIAAELDLPKSSVHRYLQMWTEEIGEAMRQKRAANEPYDPKSSPYYFPGREEYNQAKNDPKFKLLFDPYIPNDDPRYRLLMREYSIIDTACYRASQAFKKTGIAPRLTEDAEYLEFMENAGKLVQTTHSSAESGLPNTSPYENLPPLTK